MKKIAILFARKDSVYKTLPDLDVWDADRDARCWPGGSPIVAHPPCAQWGRLRHFAHADVEQKRLALLAVNLVREWGGVLEHPCGSNLWNEALLPMPGENDAFGFTLVVDQLWFGHVCIKRTWLYICGINPEQVPEIPFHLGYPSRSISTHQRAPKYLPEVSRKVRESTPLRFAQWLCDLARMTGQRKVAA